MKPKLSLCMESVTFTRTMTCHSVDIRHEVEDPPRVFLGQDRVEYGPSNRVGEDCPGKQRPLRAMAVAGFVTMAVAVAMVVAMVVVVAMRRMRMGVRV